MSSDPCCDRCGACAADCRCAGACGEIVALAPPVNRPGLATLDVRLGTHGAFLAAAKRALSSPDAPALSLLSTRVPSDPAIGWLDAWAVAADVLTFYRERITNEGYLRTAAEEISLRELARQIGYKPRPGIAASVRLAYVLDPTAAPVVIPAGAKAQTVPQPGEQMQTFETSEPLEARAEWSTMAPHQTRVPVVDRLEAWLRPRLRLDDPSLSVRPGERVLFLFGLGVGQQVVREVASARVDVQNAFVELTLRPRPGLTSKIAESLLKNVDALRKKISVDKPKQPDIAAVYAIAGYMLGASATDALDGVPEKGYPDIVNALEAALGAKVVLSGGTNAQDIDSVLGKLALGPGAQLRSNRLLQRGVVDGLQGAGAKRASLLSITSPHIERNLYAAWKKLPAIPADLDTAPQTFLLRASTGAYGAAAPQIVRNPDGVLSLVDPALAALDRKFAFLDMVVDGVVPGGYALIDSPRDDDSTRTMRFARVRNAQVSARGDYGISGKVTRLELVDPVIGDDLSVPFADAKLDFLRNTTYIVQSQRVNIAAEPINENVAGDTIYLDRLYEGLDTGRWIIVAGERTDIVVDDTPLTGIKDAELAMIADVAQAADPESPGDVPRSVLTLAKSLAYNYKLDGTTIYGNVVRASHGETVSEVIGSGDATVAFARFALRRTPLTFVAAPTTSGVQGSQSLRANGVKLQEVEALLDAGAGDRVYELAVDGNGAATATFGDGVHGARVPSGQENIRAVYRVGIGSPGNVAAGQITLLTSRPLGVKGVVNPLRSSGGADRDGPEAIRANAPLAALALSPLSRLVSVSDYEYFARRFAGIGDARATKLSDGTYQCVHVTLAGVNDIPLTLDDDLVTSLAAAYADFGDPALPVAIAIRELIALFVQARVVLRADADEDVVEPEIRRRLLDAFSFARRRLGQSAYLSEVIAVIQGVPGVDWVDVEAFGGISELQLRNPEALAEAVADLQKQVSGAPTATVVYCAEAMRATDAPPARIVLFSNVDGPVPRLLPAQLAFLVPDVPDTLVLNLS